MRENANARFFPTHYKAIKAIIRKGFWLFCCLLAGDFSQQ